MRPNVDEARPACDISVITATYNRGHLLHRLFDSLLTGTRYPREWIIVDDGSVDDTAAVVEEFKTRSPFDIVYSKKKNGGVHTAVNVAFGLLRGKMFVKVDSDDWLCPTALEEFERDWADIPDDEKSGFVGLCYLCAYEDGTMVGHSFPKDVMDGTHTEVRLNNRIWGDKTEVIRSELVHARSIAEHEGEHSVPYDGPLFPRFSRMGLKFRHINRVTKIMEYQADGLTRSTPWLKRRWKSPRGFAEMDRQMLLDPKLEYRFKGRILLQSIKAPTRRYVGPVAYGVGLFHVGLGLLKDYAGRAVGRPPAIPPVGPALGRRESPRI
jgi:glycosyltransferase involved in cell wall biosynthesis